MQKRSCCIVLPCGCLLPLMMLVVMGVGAVAHSLLKPPPSNSASVAATAPTLRGR